MRSYCGVFCDTNIRVDQTRKRSKGLLLLHGTRTLQTGGKQLAKEPQDLPYTC